MADTGETPVEPPKPTVRRPAGLIILSIGLIVLVAACVISWGSATVIGLDRFHDKGAVAMTVIFGIVGMLILGGVVYCGIRGLGKVSEENIRRVTGCCAVLVYFPIQGTLLRTGEDSFVTSPYWAARLVALPLLPLLCGALHWVMARSLVRRAGLEWPPRRYSLSKSAVSLVAVAWYVGMSAVMDWSWGESDRSLGSGAIAYLLPLALAYVLYLLGVKLFAGRRTVACGTGAG